MTYDIQRKPTYSTQETWYTMIDTIITGTDACAYPTPHGWTWASRPWCGWNFTLKVSPRDPRYASTYAGDLRHDRCFFCGEKVDPRKSEHYIGLSHGVPPTDVHPGCVRGHMKDLWHHSREKTGRSYPLFQDTDPTRDRR